MFTPLTYLQSRVDSPKENVGKRTNKYKPATGKLCLGKGVLCCQKAEGLDQPFIWKQEDKKLTAVEMELCELIE